MSELIPHVGSRADDLALIRSMHTDAFDHAPAEILFNTGVDTPGRPSAGAWVTYGLGSESQNLPGYVVLMTPPNHGWGPTDARIVEYRAAILEMCSYGGGVVCGPDLYTLLDRVTHFASEPPLEVHPNAAGHTKIAEAMEPLILELPEPQAWAMGWAALLTLSLRATQRRRDALWSSA